ncbi:MAG: hypothetical protein J6V09_00840 [Clostridia bacterium]|nr:hypothetical protein [Clostridia bacterium]
MKYKLKLFGIYLPIFLLLTAAAVTLRSIALLNSFNFFTAYYTDKLLLNISAGLVLAGAIFFVSYIFFTDREIKLVPEFNSAANYIPTALIATATAFLMKPLISDTVSIINEVKYLKSIATPSAVAQANTLTLPIAVLILTVIFAILSGINFCTAALSGKRYSTRRALLGLSTVIFFSLYVVRLYFSTDLPINSPNKIIDQISHLLAAIFFLYEARIAMGREKWKNYIAIGFIAALASAYSSIPALITYAVRGWVTSNSIYETALNLAVCIFITARVIQTGYLIEDKPSATVNALIGAANAREELINPEPQGQPDAEGECEEEYRDDNQITIDDVSDEKEANADGGSEAAEEGK